MHPHGMALAFKIGVLLTGVGIIASATIDDVLVALAPAVNTLFLIYLAWYARRHRADAEEVKQMVHDNSRYTKHAANAAASAAEAAAVAARIGKELGGTLRSTDPPNIAHPSAPTELPPRTAPDAPTG